MKSLHGSILILLAAAPLMIRGQQPVYLNPSQDFEKRVDDLIPRLTLEEKASLLCTTAPAIDRLKIPVMNGWNQSLHGVVWTKPSTMFPVNIAMAATWDTDLIHDVAAIIADEARAVNNYWPTVQGTLAGGRQAAVTVTASGERVGHNGLVYRSPVINISRHPLWGRIVEAFGEDPYLTSRMTVAYVRGTQGDDAKYLKLAATLKHFAVNNQEANRTSLSAEVSERMLMEYFLPHFKAGIMEGHAQSIMSSYNALNGVPNAENKLLLTDILRTRWKFDGFVVPDSGAVARLVSSHKKYTTIEEAAAKTILAGSDLDDSAYPAALPNAVAKGFLTEKDIDQSLRRVLKVRFRLGEFDPPDMVPYSKISSAVIDSAAHREAALRTARESIVLLTNKDGFLPLNRNKIKTIAVIGPHADRALMGIGYTGLASKFIKPLEGIKNKVATGTEVLYAQGSDILDAKDKQTSFAEAAATARRADVVILYVGLSNQIEREGLDRTYLDLPPIQEELVRTVNAANPKTVVVLLNGGPVSVKWERDNVSAVLDMFYGGEEGGNAIADVLFGDYNPGGRLPYTVYESAAQVPSMTEYDVTKGFTYMYFTGQPVYPFGHGLSYTTFRYDRLHLSSRKMRANEKLQVSVEVTNNGRVTGDEVAQLYVHAVSPSVKRPIRELRRFQRVSLKPGERRTVTFVLPGEELAYWDVSKHDFVVEPGKVDVMVGSSSADIRVKDQVEVYR